MVTVLSFSPVPSMLLQQLLASQMGDTPLHVVTFDEAAEADRKQVLAVADVALGDYTFRYPVDEPLLAQMPKLRFLQQPSAGFEHIDVQACRARGVQVANTPGVNAPAVAEHAIMLALALLKRLVLANAATHTGKWTQHELGWERGIFELMGKTWGIVGCGAVGREVAKRLGAFGVTVLYYDPRRLHVEEESEWRMKYQPLDHLLRLADVVSLHVPLTPKTRGLIGARELGLMKFNAIFINVARGECADETALADRLRAKKLGGAGVDVFSREPIAADNPLLGLDNVILTPHIAGVTAEVRDRITQMSVANVVRFLQGQQPQYLVELD
jgi:glyoxylate reductase